MKTFILSTYFLISFLIEGPTGESSKLSLPYGLEIGKTLRTDLDPTFSSRQDGISFFAPEYDAHFNKLGFLEKIVFDRSKGHTIPESWGINWNAEIDDIKNQFSESGNIKMVNRDMSKSIFVSALTDVCLTSNGKNYHFYMIDWKEASGNSDGLGRISITSSKAQ